MAQSKSQMDHELVWMPVQALARGLKRAPPPPWTLMSPSGELYYVADKGAGSDASVHPLANSPPRSLSPNSP